jgi:phosphoglycerate dehydrogenase-like enzyme
MREGTGKLRLHIENIRTQHEVFHITPERYAAAERRHADLAPLLDTTIGWDLETYPAAIREAEILIGWRFPFETMARDARALKWLHLTGAGIEHIFPLDWLPQGAAITTNRGVATKAGEYVAMAVLALNTRLPYFATNKTLRRWDRVFVSGVAGKTIVVLGMGNLGRSGARRCKELGMRVIGIRASGEPDPSVDEMHRPEDLHRLLPEADFLLVAVPLTSRTRGMIGRAELDLLKPEAGIINIARAAIVDQAALGDKLRRVELAGAVLDVFEQEPLPVDSPVWDWPNCILTPHVAADDVTRYIADTLDLFFRNLRRFIDGAPLINRVDPDRQY